MDGAKEGKIEPAACFLPQAFAEQVVSDFLAGRDPTSRGQWEPFSWKARQREVPPPDGLIQAMLGRRPRVEAADPRP